jgi:hypothetical protein
VKLIEHLKALFGHPATPPAHMAEFMAAAERVGEAARKAGVENVDDGGPFGAMANQMRNGNGNGHHKPTAAKKRVSGGQSKRPR